MKTIYVLLDCLKSSIWKIKIASLTAIAEFGSRWSNLTVPILTNYLKKFQSKEKVASTILKLGEAGEKVLIRTISDSKEPDIKLKVSILKTLGNADITSPNIDFIVESLYKLAQYIILLLNL